jgi:hypothetical protein
VDPLIVTLRLVHIISAAVWVGMVVFTSFFLGPAVQDTGPDGGKVMVALQRRGVMTVIPILGLATILPGIWLYWRASVGQPAYMTSPVGLTFGIGGLLAIAAFALGISVMRPSMMRAMRLAQEMAAITSEQDRAARMQEIGRLRARGAAAGRAVAVLLLLATAAMAAARYV